MKKLLILSAAVLFNCSQPQQKSTHYGHVIERWAERGCYNIIWYDEESGRFRTLRTWDVNYYSTYKIGDIICISQNSWE